tara:strand:- start:706 stop:1125 length:420 start_codon:yes stop_codon:yes gene_type:complete
MRKILLVSVCSAVLAGCVNQETFVKNNITYSKYEQDVAHCKTKATQEVAVNRSQGAEVAIAIFTGVYSVQDANSDARVANYNSCMISKGYQRVELPACKNNNEAKKTGVGPLTASRKIDVGTGSCYATDTQGRLIFAKQ